MALVALFAVTLLVCLAVLAIARFDLSGLLDVNLAWDRLALVLPAYVAVVLARGARLAALCPHRRSVLFLSALSSVHTLANNVLPFRSGELALPVLLKRHGAAGLAEGSGILLAIRLLDLAAVAAALLACTPGVRMELFRQWWPWLAGGLLACALLAAGALAAARRAGPAARRLLRQPAGRAEDGPAPAAGPGAAHARLRSLAAAAGATLAAWFFIFLIFRWLLEWSGVSGLTIPEAVVASAGAVAAGILPVNTLLSLGTVEAGWAAGLYLVGIEPAAGVVAGLRLHAATLALNVLFAAISVPLLRREVSSS